MAGAALPFRRNVLRLAIIDDVPALQALAITVQIFD